MATPPLKTEISDTYPNPTNAVARLGFSKLYDYVTGLLGSTGNAAEARAVLGAVNVAGDTLTGLLKFKTGTAIASTSTVDLSAATGNTVHITGTTAISAITMSNGQVMDVVFDGILTLTHNSTTNKLPSATNITTAAGDTARYFYDGSITYCLSYSRANGRAVVSSDSAIYVPVRQTVLSGPVDANGFSLFGGSTGSTTVSATGTLISTAANGFNVNGAVNRIGSATNPSWTGLSTNGTMYLYKDIASDGTCTTGSTTLAPTYRFGGADVTTNGQFTFNIQEMVGKVGNGATATQVYRVFVGEVAVSGGVVSAIIWYGLQGKYDSGYTNTFPSAGTPTTRSSNLGIIPNQANLDIKCIVANAAYLVGDVIIPYTEAGSGSYVPLNVIRGNNTLSFTTGAVTAILAPAKTTGGNTILTLTSWAYRLTATRGW